MDLWWLLGKRVEMSVCSCVASREQIRPGDVLPHLCKGFMAFTKNPGAMGRRVLYPPADWVVCHRCRYFFSVLANEGRDPSLQVIPKLCTLVLSSPISAANLNPNLAVMSSCWWWLGPVEHLPQLCLLQDNWNNLSLLFSPLPSLKCKVSFRVGRGVWKGDRKAVLVCSLFQPTLFCYIQWIFSHFLIYTFTLFFQTGKFWGHRSQVLAALNSYQGFTFPDDQF